MVQVKIIRHSERVDFAAVTTWLTRCFGQYWADSPITSYGADIAYKKGIELATSSFQPTCIYSSPYTRTIATAMEIRRSFPTSVLRFESLLAEHQPYRQHTLALYPNGIPTDYASVPTEFAYPESYAAFQSRIQFIMDKLMRAHTEDFLVVTHGEIIKMYINYFQSQYPDLLLDGADVPYLTVLAFDYDADTLEIDPSSIRIEASNYKPEKWSS